MAKHQMIENDKMEYIAMPEGTQVSSAESCGISAWTKTAKVSVILPDGGTKRYFLKVIQSIPSSDWRADEEPGII